MAGKVADSTYYYTAKDIAAVMKRSERYAYDVIKELNAELEKQGYRTSRARVPRSYFHERYNITEQPPAASKGRKTA